MLADKCDDKDAARFLRSLLKDDATEREYVTVHDEDEDEVIDDGNGSDKEVLSITLYTSVPSPSMISGFCNICGFSSIEKGELLHVFPSCRLVPERIDENRQH